ncbi:conserved protein of unknown function [Enterobacter cancerogenus]|uniref:DUF551 domain-containing protein n=1 Tax=Enterobacter cancerogenus TaxID=69218 RepID=UPI001925A939|nr:DUF551 domain-containing protein [Enterobacter cancerogenus]CAD5356079.1 conserved protein of unknown function [Enterobacter cancerogenus]
MSTITRERLREHAREKVKSLEFAVTQAAFSDSRAELEEELELARIALASLEAEPVAYIRDGFRTDGVHFCGGIITAEEHERTKPALSDRYNWKHQPLYTAPPAPVSVPDDVSGPLAHAYKELTPTFMRNHIDVFERYGIYPDGSAGIQAMRIALDGMTRRPAMLHAGNSPVIQDGWVACSERMPDEDGNYWGWWSESKRQGPAWFIKSELQAQFQSSEITHWMPLPAAPQKHG